MPVEATLLRHRPEVFLTCTKCGFVPFQAFMRGQVQRTPLAAPFTFLRAWFRKEPFHYCAVICSACKAIVGWESP
jgi:hypothetical protein